MTKEEAIAKYLDIEERRLQINLKYATTGVEFIDIRQAYISETAVIGAGTVIGPCVTIEGDTVIGENCIVGQNTRIVDSTVGDNVTIQSSVILESTVGEGTTVGPFAYLRPNSHIGKSCRVGDFVEVKNSSLGDGTKASHLTYIGDADVGQKVNLGCGVVFVNYDGSKKYRTSVGDGSFIGCNTNLIAPVKVGNKAYTAAGSTVTKDIPDGALHIARCRDSIIEGWVEKRGLLKK